MTKLQSITEGNIFQRYRQLKKKKQRNKLSERNHGEILNYYKLYHLFLSTLVHQYVNMTSRAIITSQSKCSTEYISCFMTLTHDISRPPKTICQSFQTYDSN